MNKEERKLEKELCKSGHYDNEKLGNIRDDLRYTIEGQIELWSNKVLNIFRLYGKGEITMYYDEDDNYLEMTTECDENVAYLQARVKYNLRMFQGEAFYKTLVLKEECKEDRLVFRETSKARLIFRVRLFADAKDWIGTSTRQPRDSYFDNDDNIVMKINGNKV